jgi:uncharacterized protein (DUF305 family)
MNRLLKITALFSGLLALSISLSGCGSPAATDATNEKKQSSEHGAHSIEITDRKSFAQAMIPHHAQAIEMSQIALDNTTNPDLLAIAEQMIAEQSAEIEVMSPWLDDESLDYTMMMDGMLTESQLEELRSTKDAEFDVLYSQYMILHHEGALEMANKVIESEDIFLSELGYQIIDEQTAEIALLEGFASN